MDRWLPWKSMDVLFLRQRNKGGSDVRVNKGANYKAVSVRKKLHSQRLDFTNV